MQSIWWNGPSWLAKPRQWPEYSIPEVNSQAEMKSEMKKEIIFEAKLIVGEDTSDTSSSSTATVDLSDVNTDHFSSLQILLQTTAWIFHYANKFLKKQIDNKPITATEIKKAKEL